MIRPRPAPPGVDTLAVRSVAARFMALIKVSRSRLPKESSKSVHYVSGYNVLEKDGLDGLLRLLGAIVVRHKTSVLVVDGVSSADEFASTKIDLKKFVHNLNSVVGLSGCTTLLLSSLTASSWRPEYTMVDGIVHLTVEQMGMRVSRELEVAKFRGSSHLHGRHFFQIGPDGITVFSRFESLYRENPSPRADPRKLLPVGIKGLDRLFGGGLPEGSSTSIVGPAGSGKSSIGLSFLETGARTGEQVLLVSLYENPTLLLDKLAAFGRDVAKHIRRGRFRVVRRLPTEVFIDQLLQNVAQEVNEHRVRRVFIDGLSGLKQKGMLGFDRIQEIMKTLIQSFSGQGITTLYVEETDSTIGVAHNPVTYDSAITDNIIELRHVQAENRRTLAINVLKKRSGPLDSSFHELIIGKRGPEVGRTIHFVHPILPAIQYAESGDRNTE